jgi:hypothetical protein
MHPSDRSDNQQDRLLMAHEALDRGHMVNVLFEQVASHPFVEESLELSELARIAGEALCDLYQAIGRKGADI